ncbi:MAG: DNA-processing protein DprA [Gemmatimonadota bacterium]|nr:DNA-processing protein DprA [Gemmatimonadota bacterium]
MAAIVAEGAATEEIRRSDPRYPAALLDLPAPPARMWARGDRALLDMPCVAVVGTRRATPYAERVAAQISTTLVRAGACVVSGLARGVDGVAHRAALAAGGATIAVLGTGLDVAYPRGHEALQEEIGRVGLLLSELEPRNRAHAGSFPNRNRIIAAISSLTIVVEGGVGSGALITARNADELGRTVAVVPGPIDVPQSRGSNELLREGAHPITSMADVLSLAGLTAPILISDLPADGCERRVWDALALGGADVDTLCTRARLPAHEGMAAVTALELRGLVECALSGEVRRI